MEKWATWTDRLKQRMKELQFTQEKLAEKMHITRSAITHHLSGNRTPTLKNFNQYAKVLKCDPAWLQFGIETKPFVNTTTDTSTKLADIQIVDWKELTKKNKKTLPKNPEHVPCLCHQNKKADLFAVRVKGDAMLAPGGNTQSFVEGTILIVDPDKEAVHGNFVIALPQNSKEATFKQYVVDSGIKYLKPLNPQYPMVRIEKATNIIGTVIGSIILFT